MKLAHLSHVHFFAEHVSCRSREVTGSCENKTIGRFRSQRNGLLDNVSHSLWGDRLLPFALNDPQSFGPLLRHFLSFIGCRFRLVSRRRDSLNASNIDAFIGTEPASRLEADPLAKVVNKLPYQILKPVWFQIFKMKGP